MERVILARHGETVSSSRGEVSGDPNADNPLTARGREQAMALGRTLQNECIDLGITSRFGRTRETADLALAGREVERLEMGDLDDLAFGVFEARPLEEYRTWARNHSMAARIPAGESRVALVRRYVRAMRAMLALPRQTILVVGHGLPLTYILQAAQGELPRPGSGHLARDIGYATPHSLGASALESAVMLLEKWMAEYMAEGGEPDQILRLSELRYTPDLPNRIGGKGAGLVRLIELGLPVPPAVVIPVEANGTLDDPDVVVSLLGEPLAVRSSATGEDAADRSAAGQYESLMDVRREGLVAAVERVYHSAELDRVKVYTGNEGAGMAVVVQREVRASRAGVAFSRDPLGHSDDTIVECVFGPGEELVSGRKQPDRYRISGDGTVRAELVPKEEPYRLLRTLRDDEVHQVATLTRRAAAGFGCPVDIEFCFERTSLWVVQCRAITTLR